MGKWASVLNGWAISYEDSVQQSLLGKGGGGFQNLIKVASTDASNPHLRNDLTEAILLTTLVYGHSEAVIAHLPSLSARQRFSNRTTEISIMTFLVH